VLLHFVELEKCENICNLHLKFVTPSSKSLPGKRNFLMRFNGASGKIPGAESSKWALNHSATADKQTWGPGKVVKGGGG